MKEGAARWRLLGVLGLGCLPEVGPSADAGASPGDALAVACGHRDTPCCREGAACRAGAVCREGRCAADRARCVATGIANADVTREVTWEESSVPACAAIPAALLDPRTPGWYAPGDRAVGLLECEGLPPGPRRLRVRLHVRMLSAHHEAGACECHVPVVATLQLVLNGREVAPLPSIRREVDDADRDDSCRRGPDADLTVAVEVPSSGNFSARLDLVGCERERPTRCLFVRGTAMTLEPSP